jgi:hypothetical protein
MPELAASLDAPPSGRATPVWFDSLAYCRRKLLDGRPVPWASPGELSAFFARAQSMFRSDALVVELADLCAQRVERDDALRGAMAARTRPGAALRALLADEGVRAAATDALAVVGGASAPVVLSVPAPARWLAIAAEQAGAVAAAPETRHVEAAAMYVADFLRAFAGARVDGLLLDDDASADVEAYRPVLNVAANYRWPVWVRTDEAPCWPQGPIDGVAGWIGARAPEVAAGHWGIVLEAGAASVSDGEVILAVVPEAADPDSVMAWVRQLS